jgi:hypothetical protein
MVGRIERNGLWTPACFRIEIRDAKSGTSAMKDYLARVEKLRKDAAECALIRDLATDQAKRELFDRLHSHLTVLADQVEQAIMHRKTGLYSGLED